jgi:hypothetical protein
MNQWFENEGLSVDKGTGGQVALMIAKLIV